MALKGHFWGEKYPFKERKAHSDGDSKTAISNIRKPLTSIMMFYLKNVFIKKNGVLFNEMSRSNIIEYNRRSLL